MCSLKLFQGLMESMNDSMRPGPKLFYLGFKNYKEALTCLVVNKQYTGPLKQTNRLCPPISQSKNPKKLVVGSNLISGKEKNVGCRNIERDLGDSQVRFLRRCTYRSYVYIRQQQHQYQEIHGKCNLSLSLTEYHRDRLEM